MEDEVVLDEPPGGGNLVANNTQKSKGGNLIEFITDAALRVVAARGRIGGARRSGARMARRASCVSPTYLCNYSVE